MKNYSLRNQRSTWTLSPLNREKAVNFIKKNSFSDFYRPIVYIPTIALNKDNKKKLKYIFFKNIYCCNRRHSRTVVAARSLKMETSIISLIILNLIQIGLNSFMSVVAKEQTEETNITCVITKTVN